MHRTQLMLEEWQYEALRQRAETSGKSISALVREILATHLAARPGAKRLELMEGVAEGPTDLARDHDRELYGKRE
jgi:hypothetical protein